MRRLLPYLLAVVVVTVVGLALVPTPDDSDRSAAGDGAREDTPPVIVEEVALETELTRVQAVGTARALQSVGLFPAVADEVVELNFSPGARVEAGQTLMVLDNTYETLAVDLARVQVKNAQQLLERYERIEGTGAVSASAIDEARAELEAARIELQQAEEALKDHTLRAPFSGYIGLTDIDVGDRVDTATQITTLDDRSVLLIDFEIPEAFIQELRIGSPVSLASWAAPAATVEGSIDAIDSRIDPVSRTFRVRARFDNSDDRFRPGMSFRISLTLPGRELAAIPEVAVQWGGDGSFLWMVKDGHAQRVPVTIIQRREGTVLVEAPLKENDLIVVEGVQRMREGVPVRYADADPAAGGRPVVAESAR